MYSDAREPVYDYVTVVTRHTPLQSHCTLKLTLSAREHALHAKLPFTESRLPLYTATPPAPACLDSLPDEDVKLLAMCLDSTVVGECEPLLRRGEYPSSLLLLEAGRFVLPVPACQVVPRIALC